MFRWFLIAVTLAAAIIGLVIGALNPDVVELELLVTSFRLPLGALVIAGLAAGALAGLLLSWLMFILPGRLGASSTKRNNKGKHLADQPDG